MISVIPPNALAVNVPVQLTVPWAFASGTGDTRRYESVNKQIAITVRMVLVYMSIFIRISLIGLYLITVIFFGPPFYDFNRAVGISACKTASEEGGENSE